MSENTQAPEDRVVGEIDYIAGGRRCAIEKFELMDDWWVGISPRNGEGAMVEGSWADWVTLARAIVAEDERRALLDQESVT